MTCPVLTRRCELEAEDVMVGYSVQALLALSNCACDVRCANNTTCLTRNRASQTHLGWRYHQETPTLPPAQLIKGLLWFNPVSREYLSHVSPVFADSTTSECNSPRRKLPTSSSRTYSAVSACIVPLAQRRLSHQFRALRCQ